MTTSSIPEEFFSVSRDCGTINLKGNLNSAKKLSAFIWKKKKIKGFYFPLAAQWDQKTKLSNFSY